MKERPIDQVLCQALALLQEQVTPHMADKQVRDIRNEHIQAEVTKVITAQQKTWEVITSLSDLTREVCLELQRDFNAQFLMYAVHGESDSDEDLPYCRSKNRSMDRSMHQPGEKSSGSAAR